CSGFTHITARWIARPPKATFVTRLQCDQLPSHPARQLPDLSTTIWVDSSSTGDTRPSGHTAICGETDPDVASLIRATDYWDVMGGAVDHELHQHAGVAAGHRRLDRAEIGLVDIDVAELRARLRLGQAHGADLGLREHRRRDGGVIDLDRALAEHGVGEGMALADRDRR